MVPLYAARVQHLGTGCLDLAVNELVQAMGLYGISKGLPRDWGCGSKRVLSGSLIGEAETAWPGS